MNKVYFTVGPSQIYPTVTTHLRKAIDEEVLSASHRGDWFREIYHGATSELRKLLSIPQDHKIFFLSSATEGMERVIQNTVSRTSSHVITGAFGEKFIEIASDLRVATARHNVGMQDPFPTSLPFEKTDVICFTQNDTSTGYRIPMSYIYQVREAYPDSLIALDVVSSIPYVDINYSKVDMTLFSVQKGFGLPAGLGVLIVSPRAYSRSVALAKKKSTGSFHSFVNLEKYAQDNQTFETPNVLGIYLFWKVLQDLGKIGIERLRSDTEEKAENLYKFFAEMEQMPVVTQSEFQSITTPVISLPGKVEKVVAELSKKGIEVGAGYGKEKNDQLRIANFPAHSVEDVRKLTREMKTILK